MRPTFYIIRGLPGSGKSTLARKLVSAERHREADQFFTRDGEYWFDAPRLKDAHTWCLRQARSLLPDDADIAVSNTFTQRWEYQPYIDAALEFGYEVQVIECHGNWLNVHRVPEAAMERMRARWEPHKPR